MCSTLKTIKRFSCNEYLYVERSYTLLRLKKMNKYLRKLILDSFFGIFSKSLFCIYVLKKYPSTCVQESASANLHFNSTADGLASHGGTS